MKRNRIFREILTDTEDFTFCAKLIELLVSPMFNEYGTNELLCIIMIVTRPKRIAINNSISAKL